MAESRGMSKSELFTHFAERFGIKRAQAGEFFDELQQLTEQELLRCGEFVLPGIAKLVVQQREKRMGRNPATGARVEILHSRLHELWSLRLCTWLGKGNDPRYTPSTTFEVALCIS